MLFVLILLEGCDQINSARSASAKRGGLVTGGLAVGHDAMVSYAELALCLTQRFSPRLYRFLDQSVEPFTYERGRVLCLDIHLWPREPVIGRWLRTGMLKRS